MSTSIRVLGPLGLGTLIVVTGYWLRSASGPSWVPAAIPAPPAPTAAPREFHDTTPTMLTPRLADIPHPPREFELPTATPGEVAELDPRAFPDDRSSSGSDPEGRAMLRPEVPHRHEL